MTRILLSILGVLAVIVAWVVVVFVGVSEGRGKSALTSSDTPADFVEAARQIVEAEHRGNLSMLVLEAGKVSGAYHFSIGEPVDQASVFQVASMSKWITAWGVMALVEAEVIDLDRPVSDYVSRWQLPEN
ncbi:MAG: serine hydrolase [Halioglobus sp.]